MGSQTEKSLLGEGNTSLKMSHNLLFFFLCVISREINKIFTFFFFPVRDVSKEPDSAQ